MTSPLWKESDLHAPVCSFLRANGYAVRSEAKDCDIAAQKEEELLIVELKTAFNLKLVYQLMERKKMTEQVYAAIVRPKTGQNAKAWKQMIQLLKKLEVGLLTVALDSGLQAVDVILTPQDGGSYKNRRKIAALKKEISGRQQDFNEGGISRKKILTAYREKTIWIGCIMEQKGNLTTRELRGLGFETTAILSGNREGLFERVEKGNYTLSDNGRHLLASEDFKEAVAFYQEKARQLHQEEEGELYI